MGVWLRRSRDGEGAELEVGHLVAHEATGQAVGVDRAVVEAGAVGADQGGLEEADVEAHVVPDHHRAADELEEGGQHLVDRGRRQHHGLGDAGEHGDLGRDGQARVDEGLEGAEALAAAQLHRADLGDRAVGRRAAGGLEVDHDEGDVVQRGAEVVEGPLPGNGRCSHLPLVDEHVFERKDPVGHAHQCRRSQGHP